MTSKLIALAKILSRPSLAPAYTRPLNGILIGGGTATSTDETRTENHNGTDMEHPQQERGFLLFDSLVKRNKNTKSSYNYNRKVIGEEEGGTIRQEVTKEYYRSAITGNDKNIWNINLTL